MAGWQFKGAFSLIFGIFIFSASVIASGISGEGDGRKALDPSPSNGANGEYHQKYFKADHDFQVLGFGSAYDFVAETHAAFSRTQWLFEILDSIGGTTTKVYKKLDAAYENYQRLSQDPQTTDEELRQAAQSLLSSVDEWHNLKVKINTSKIKRQTKRSSGLYASSTYDEEKETIGTLNKFVPGWDKGKPVSLMALMNAARVVLDRNAAYLKKTKNGKFKTAIDAFNDVPRLEDFDKAYLVQRERQIRKFQHSHQFMIGNEDAINWTNGAEVSEFRKAITEFIAAKDLRAYCQGFDTQTIEINSIMFGATMRALEQFITEAIEERDLTKFDFFREKLRNTLAAFSELPLNDEMTAQLEANKKTLELMDKFSKDQWEQILAKRLSLSGKKKNSCSQDEKR